MIRDFATSPRRVALLMSVLCFVVFSGIRHAGLLESLEMVIYDHYVRVHAVKWPADERILLVGAREDDLNRWGWPLSDDLLATTLEQLLVYRPAAIGVDLYRPTPLEPGHEKLVRVLTGNPRVIAVTKIGDGRDTGVPPPPFLDRAQVAAVDVVPDPSGIVRRGLLFLDDGKETFTGFAMRLALLYLQPLGIVAEPGDADPAHLKLGRNTIPPLEPDDGGYAGVDAAGYQFLLDFAGGPTPFRRVSLTQVLSGQTPPEWVRGRVVIVGITAPSVKDYFDTPFSTGKYAKDTVYGITLHAHVTSQLMRMAVDGTPPISVLKGWQAMAWIALWFLLGGLSGVLMRNFHHVVVGIVFGLGVSYGLGYLALSYRLWLPVAHTLLGGAAAAALTIAYLSALERKQRGELMRIFARYVSSEVASDIWNRREEIFEAGRPKPQRLDVTVLFSDIRGFTTISEHLSPEELMDWLNTYMTAMANLVARHGGMVDMYIGDSVMALFGAPVRRAGDGIEEDAIHAVECALAMGAEVKKLNDAWSRQGLPIIAIRVGIFSGPVVAGSLGSSDRLEYTVIGDTVNTASRLEGLDKDWPGLAGGEYCRILVGEATKNYLGERYDTLYMGSVKLKGKEQEIRVFRILGPKGPPR